MSVNPDYLEHVGSVPLDGDYDLLGVWYDFSEEGFRVGLLRERDYSDVGLGIAFETVTLSDPLTVPEAIEEATRLSQGGDIELLTQQIQGFGVSEQDCE